MAVSQMGTVWMKCSTGSMWKSRWSKIVTRTKSFRFTSALVVVVVVLVEVVDTEVPWMNGSCGVGCRRGDWRRMGWTGTQGRSRMGHQAYELITIEVASSETETKTRYTQKGKNERNEL
eukprot:5315177-Amphidinium_carterae.3